MISATLVDRGHHAVGTVQLHDLLVRACPTIAANPGATGAYLRCQVRLSHHLEQLVAYQPPSHYWPLQALETGIFLAAAFALIVATIWRVGRRSARKPAVGEPRERTADPLALEAAPEIGVPPVRLPEDGEQSTPRHLHRASANRCRLGTDMAFHTLD